MIKYTYEDYEDAYCNNQVEKCQEIGNILLEKLNTKDAKQLIKKLNSINIEDKSEHGRKDRAEILLDVKVWLMINE